ncbi:MAG: cell division protein ZapE [Gammaproteobacteria bacterium]|nr:cell division protein ZapE [Gammaproteobacteria bacterium]
MNTNFTPRARYDHEIETGILQPDPMQAKAVDALQNIYQALLVSPPEPEGGVPGWLKSLMSSTRISSALRSPAPGAPIRGLYLFGGVGRGKTHLVDSFHDALPFAAKMRIHFHRFMQRVHAELKTLRRQSDPLLSVAERLASEARVLTFDEFHVADVTDAMLLGRLLEALFARRVTLITTSNIHPDDLYAGGLQRARFLPAIALLKEHTTVMHLNSDNDYRLRLLEQAEIYHCPLDDTAHESLAASFDAIAPYHSLSGEALDILGRSIDTVRSAPGIVWFDFYAICDGPRGAADYIEIGRLFHTVLVSNVPQFSRRDNDRALRFTLLVDELYDRSVNLIVSAAAAPHELYLEGRHEFAFQRTASRLTEMGSTQYLRKPHLP